MEHKDGRKTTRFIHEFLSLVDAKATDQVNLERLVFLVDGVFAITLTLLVLELHPPDVSAENLIVDLSQRVPRLSIFLIAFYTIANHWNFHQQCFRHIKNGDMDVVWLTIINLLFITLMPATTALIGHFPNAKLAVACFSCSSFLQALTSWIFWVYVTRHHMSIASNANPEILSINRKVWLSISTDWLPSIFVSFLNVYTTYVCWILWPNMAAAWANHQHRSLDLSIVFTN